MYKGDLKQKDQLETNQSVIALYEIIPVDQKTDRFNIEGLTTQNQKELYQINIEYKDFETGQLKTIFKSVNYNLKRIEETSDNYQFSAAVAMFGLILRNSKYKKNARCGTVIQLAHKSSNDDLTKKGFISLVKKYRRGTFTSQLSY